MSSDNNNNNNNGNAAMNNNDRRRLMQSIYEIGFVLIETMLFLDTHPDDLEAIEYYTENKEKYRDLVKQYSEYYGPINPTNMTNENYWMWVATPMPWEVEE
jgi:spore coat protein JB